MAVKAIARGVRMSPRKVGVVAGLVRGRTVADALTILEHTPRRSALDVKKTILSARANAEHNHGLKPDTLNIIAITVTPGPRLKRFRPAAHGRALPFMRRTSHITVIVDGEERVLVASPTKGLLAHDVSKSLVGFDLPVDASWRRSVACWFGNFLENGLILNECISARCILFTLPERKRARDDGRSQVGKRVKVEIV